MAHREQRVAAGAMEGAVEAVAVAVAVEVEVEVEVEVAGNRNPILR